MIDKYKYVIILGAGASIPFGFPSGDDLYKKIRDNIESDVSEYIDIKKRKSYGPFDYSRLQNEAKEFSEALKKVSVVSIDKYLNINPKFKDIGIKSIISEIVKCEKLHLENMRNSDNNTDDWCKYLIRKMTESLNTAEELLNIKENQISFITFNYDRSLEFILHRELTGLLENTEIQQQAINDTLNKIKIIHVYGQVGWLPWQKSENNQKLAYGEIFESVFETAEKVAESIEVMYSLRIDKNEILEAIQLISKADRILFLGFGYDQENLKILKFPIEKHSMQIYGTAFKQTSNEIINNENKVCIRSNDKNIKFVDCNSIFLLREYLV